MSKKIAEGRLPEVLKRLKSENLRCLDVETSGLDARRCHIVGYVLTFSADPRDSYYLPFRHAGGGNLFGITGPQTKHGWDRKVHPAEAELIKAIDRQGTTTFGHNIAFDLRFTWSAGMQALDTRFEDTIINAPLLDEYSNKFSLDYLCQQAGVAAKKKERMDAHIKALFPNDVDIGGKGDRAPMGHYWRLAGDDPMAVEYAEGDGTSTWQLRDWQMPQIEAQDMQLVWDIESRLIPVLARMSGKGIRIDEERLDWVINYLETKLERMQEAFNKHIPGFNAKSPADVQQWVGAIHGRTDWPLTLKTGRPSFTEDWLSTHEPGRAIVEMRGWRTILDSFARPMKEEHLFEGRVHATYNQLRNDDFGTVTGRLSCSAPNLQQVPKRIVERGKLIRSFFVPDEDHIWANADYKQCEPVLLAFYSRAKVLVEGYRANPPIDAHSAVTRAINKQWRDIPLEDFFQMTDIIKSKEFKLAREMGKRVNQTLLTGGGRRALVDRYHVENVEQVLSEYFEAMPEIKQLQLKAARVFRQRGYVVSLLGRRARLRDPNKDYTAVNRLLQCGNADLIKLKMVQIDDYLKSEGRPLDLLNNIHDDIGFQFPEEARTQYEECLRIMADFSEGQPIELDIPLGVDAGEGRNWACASYGDDDVEDA